MVQYLAQINPPPDECVRQLNTTISWYVWKWQIFSLPLSTLQRRKGEGGWELIYTLLPRVVHYFYTVCVSKDYDRDH